MIALKYQRRSSPTAYIVSGSMQGIVWSICPQIVGLDRQYLVGIRHDKQISFSKNNTISYTIKGSMMEPLNNYEGKVINIYNHIGRTPIVAVGNTYSDFGMFHLVSCSPYPHLALMLNHDDSKREYSYPPCYGKDNNWRDTLRLNNWLQADMSREFKIVWKKQNDD